MKILMGEGWILIGIIFLLIIGSSIMSVQYRQCKTALGFYSGDKKNFTDRRDYIDWYLDDGGDLAREFFPGKGQYQ